MLRRIVLACSLVAALGASAAAFADKPPVYRGLFEEAAVGGYDPVAYFTTGMPVEGRKAYEYKYKDATWRFSSAENLATFKADPDRYAPQYGGYCAWAVSQGYTAKGDPKNWRIVGGKLYLNYNNDIQKKWEKDIPGFVMQADGNWPMVLEK